MKNSWRSIILDGGLLAGLILSSCAPKPSLTPTATAPADAPAETAVPPDTAVPSATPIAFPALTLKQGDYYFSLDGIPSFVFSRNVAGYQQVHYQTFLGWTKAGGSRFVRIQLDSLGMGYTRTGEVDPNWLAQWDQVLEKAETNGIYVLPVFSGWFDWNEGAGYSTWKSNPLNRANGGPVKNAAELFQKDSLTQALWLHWMETIVRHWQGRKNIIAWEIFSEVNLASGTTEANGMDFVDSAAGILRAADAAHRPVTASLADTGGWPNFYHKASIDFINIHPYPPSAQLDRTIISEARKALATYKKPVLLGESGLNAESPEKYPPKAEIGVRHAIWAAIVSGTMNGRALYWEDSFGIYFPGLAMPFVEKYKTEELPAVNFVKGVDFSGFRPLSSSSSSGVWGAAVGNEDLVLGWYREAGSEPPDWRMQAVVSKQTVTITVPGSNANWRVDFYDTKTGSDIIRSNIVSRNGSTVSISLPDFMDDIAFKMYDSK